jgi:hypothetical protein
MKTNSKEQILTAGLRDTLKLIMQKEIEKLPKHLETLEPRERVALLCKLMPFVFPKVESVAPTQGEPLQWN